jgi:hypothetical protein
VNRKLNFNEEAHLEQFKSLMQVSVLALRSAMIINGGAALALLTFLGNLKENTGMLQFICALKFYIVGVALAALATGISYLAQYRYLQELKNDSANDKGQYITYITIALVFISYAAFIVGGIEASSGFNERI